MEDKEAAVDLKMAMDRLTDREYRILRCIENGDCSLEEILFRFRIDEPKFNELRRSIASKLSGREVSIEEIEPYDKNKTSKYIDRKRYPRRDTLLRNMQEWSWETIARKYGMTPNAVRQAAKSYGIYHLFNHETKQEIEGYPTRAELQEALRTLSWNDITRKWGHGYQTIQWLIAEYKLHSTLNSRPKEGVWSEDALRRIHQGRVNGAKAAQARRLFLLNRNRKPLPPKEEMAELLEKYSLQEIGRMYRRVPCTVKQYAVGLGLGHLIKQGFIENQAWAQKKAEEARDRHRPPKPDRETLREMLKTQTFSAIVSHFRRGADKIHAWIDEYDLRRTFLKYTRLRKRMMLKAAQERIQATKRAQNPLPTGEKWKQMLLTWKKRDICAKYRSTNDYLRKHTEQQGLMEYWNVMNIERRKVKKGLREGPVRTRWGYVPPFPPKEEFERLLRSGASIRDIEKITGRSIKTIKKFAQSHGLSDLLPKKKIVQKKPSAEEFKQFSSKELAEKYGVRPSTVTQWARQAGVPYRHVSQVNKERSVEKTVKS